MDDYDEEDCEDDDGDYPEENVEVLPSEYELSAATLVSVTFHSSSCFKTFCNFARV